MMAYSYVHEYKGKFIVARRADDGKYYVRLSRRDRAANPDISEVFGTLSYVAPYCKQYDTEEEALEAADRGE